MIINMNFNGMEVPVEIPTHELTQMVSQGMETHEVFPKVTRDGEFYLIEHGNGLIELGGVAYVETSNKGGNFEGASKINFPRKLDALNVQVTCEDSPVGSIQESAHFGGLTQTGMTVYATHTGASPTRLRVRWLVKGAEI